MIAKNVKIAPIADNAEFFSLPVDIRGVLA